MQAAVFDVVPNTSFDISSLLYPELSDLSPITPGSTETSPTFQVDSLKKADWAVARILDAESRMTRRTELASELHSRVEAWLSKANAPDNDTVSYLSSLLRPFVEAELSKVRRSRSLLLPSGTAQLRKLPDKVDIVDRDAALAYCKENLPGLVIVREDLSKTELKKAVFDGNAIPGVEAELGHDELYVKASA